MIFNIKLTVKIIEISRLYKRVQFFGSTSLWASFSPTGVLDDTVQQFPDEIDLSAEFACFYPKSAFCNFAKTAPLVIATNARNDNYIV